MLYIKNLKKGFTLVELIVVIVILAILATIAFLSFSSQSSSARDSTRLTDMSNIAEGLGVNQSISGNYPAPDKNIKLFSGTTLIGHQGEAGSSTLNIIKFSAGGGKDPLDKSFYTYSINLTKNKFQLLAFLENKNLLTLNPFENSMQNFNFGFDTNATEYDERYPYEKGDKLGIVLLKEAGANSGSISYTPIQDISSLQSSSTGFVITDTNINTGMVALINNSISATGVTVNALAGFTSPVNPLPPAAIDPELATTALYSSSDADLKKVFSGAVSDYAKGWKTNGCTAVPNIVNISDVTSFNTSLNGKTLTQNTIYKVANGNYNLDGGILMTNCTAIIGQSRGGVIIKRNYNDTTAAGMVNKNSNSNSILTSITLDGNKSNFTYANSYGIYWYSAKNSTLKNISIINNKSHGVMFGSYADYNILDDFIINNNVVGLYLGSNGNTFKNFQIYNNSNNGTFLTYASGNVMENFKIYNNINHGIHLYPNNCIGNIFNNTMVFNNNANGIYIQGSAHTHNSFNNIQVFNNGSRGILLENAGVYNHFNNIMNYSNGGWGVDINVGTNHIFNDNYIYNNGATFLMASATSNKYYGISKIFSQTTNTNPLDIGTGAYLGWSDGVLDLSGTADCSWHAKPGDNNDFGATCTSRGRITHSSTPIIKYNFGANIINQKKPVRWNGTAFELYGTDGTDYFSSKKIGE